MSFLKIVSIFILCLFATISTIAQTLDWTKKANPLSLSVNSVAFNSTGTKVLSGTNCHPASVRMFDVASANLDWDYDIGTVYMCIMGVTFSANSKYIAAIEENGNVFLFDNSGATPMVVDTIDTNTSYGFCTAISPASDKLAVGCSNGKLRIYDLPSATLTNTLNAHNWVTTVAYSPNGNYIVTGGNDYKVKIWDASGNLLFTCSGHTFDITNVKVSPDNKHVISSSKDDKIKIWDIQNGALVRTLSGHRSDVNGVDVSPDGTKLVSASSDSTLKIWNFMNGDLISSFGITDSGSISTVAWSPKGDKIVSGNLISDICVWSVPAALNLIEKKHSKFDLSISPNPVKDVLSIGIPAGLKVRAVKIIDFSGQIISSFTTEKVLDVAQLPQGIYIVYLEFMDNFTAVQHFVKD